MIHLETFTQTKMKSVFDNTIFLFRTLAIAFLLPASMSLMAQEYSRVACFKVPYPEMLTDVYFMKLKLYQKDMIVSENLYWRGKEEGNLKALRDLPLAKIDQRTEVVKVGDQCVLSAKLNNRDDIPAVMIRLKVVREKSGDRILPVLYSDNYITLTPGEEKTVPIEPEQADTR